MAGNSPSSLSPRPIRGLLLMVLSALSFGALPIMMRLLTDIDLGVGVQVFARLLIGSLSLLLWNRLFSNKNFQAGRDVLDRRFFLVNGLILFAAFSTFNLSISLGTPPAKAVLLVYTSPLLTVLLSKAILGEDLNARKVLSTAGGILGAFIALKFWDVQDLLTFHLGDLFALSNGVLTSLILIFGKKGSSFSQLPPLVSLQNSLLAALLWGLLVGLPLRFGLSNNLSIWALDWNSRSLLLLALLGLCGTTIPYILLYSGLCHLQASKSALVMLLEPVSVFVLQGLFLGLPIFWYQIAGGGLLLICGVFARLDLS